MSQMYLINGSTDGRRWQETIEADGYEVGVGGNLIFFKNNIEYMFKEYIITLAAGQWHRVTTISS